MCLNKNMNFSLRIPFLCLESLLINNCMVYSPNLYWEVHQEVTLFELRCFINVSLIYPLPASEYTALLENFEAEMIEIMCCYNIKIEQIIHSYPYYFF